MRVEVNEGNGKGGPDQEMAMSIYNLRKPLPQTYTHTPNSYIYFVRVDSDRGPKSARF